MQHREPSRRVLVRRLLTVCVYLFYSASVLYLIFGTMKFLQTRDPLLLLSLLVTFTTLVLTIAQKVVSPLE